MPTGKKDDEPMCGPQPLENNKMLYGSLEKTGTDLLEKQLDPFGFNFFSREVRFLRPSVKYVDDVKY